MFDDSVAVVLESYANLLRKSGRVDEATVMESRAATIWLRIQNEP